MLSKAVKFYDDLMAKADPRVEEYFMMSSPIPSLVISIVYVVGIKMGPWIMQNRKPLELRNVMLAYNFAMVVLSGYTFMEFGLAGWFSGYTLGCQEVDYSNSPRALRMVNVCWLYFFTKFIELLDTVFFVLRKKFNQCSFLHVFHHGVMPFFCWVGVKFVAGGFGTFLALLNSFIHFVMYSYYGLSALGPKYQKYLWWKKYMTVLQLIQFALVLIHSSQLFFFKDCNYPLVFGYWILTFAIVFLIMFSNFYLKSYRSNANTASNRKRTVSANDTNGTASTTRDLKKND